MSDEPPLSVEPLAVSSFFYQVTAGTTPAWCGTASTSAGTNALAAWGWQVGKTATSTPFMRGFCGATGTSSASAAASSLASATGPRLGTGAGATTASDFIRTNTTLLGAFPAGNWTFNFYLRTSVGSTQAGRIRFRVWAAKDPTGQADDRELSTGVLVASTVAPSTAGTNYNSTYTWAAPALQLRDEYLFIQVEWEITTAGGSNTANVLFYSISTPAQIITTNATALGYGTLADTEDPDTAGFAGQVVDPPVTGTISDQEDPDTAAFPGLVGLIGSFAEQDDPDTSVFPGSVEWPPITGTLAEQEDPDTAGFPGTIIDPVTGTLSVTDPADTAAFPGAITNDVTGSLSVIEAPDTGFTLGNTPQPNFLLHGEAFTDSSGNNHAVAAGGSTISTVQKKFGASSIFITSNNAFTLDAAADLSIGSADNFNIDFWAYPTTTASVHPMAAWNAGATDNLVITIRGSGALQIFDHGGLVIVGGTAFTLNGWNHVALSRQGGSLRAFLNGVQQGSTQNGNVATFPVSGAAPKFGNASVGGTQQFQGYLDEVRFIKGTAVWTANFTPPAVPYALDGGGFPGTVIWLTSLASSEAPDTAAFAGSVVWQTSLAAIESGDTAAIPGTVFNTSTGSLSVTEALDPAAFAGTAFWTGSYAATEALDTAALAGTVQWTTALSAAETPDAGLFSANVAWLGTFAASEAADTANFGSMSGITGSFNVSEKVDPFSPTQIPGLNIWVDASQLGLADGAALPNWPNLAATGPQLVVEGSPIPTLRTNALSGLSVVRCVTSGGRYRATATGVTYDYTLVYVGRLATAVPGRVISAAYPSGGNLLFGYWNGFMDLAYATGGGGFFQPDVRKAITTEWKLYSADCDTPAVAPRFFSNGVYLNTHPAPPASDGWGNTFNISGYGTSTEETCDCEIAEIGFYNRKLTDAERVQVEDYLRAKWIIGVPLSAGETAAFAGNTFWQTSLATTEARDSAGFAGLVRWTLSLATLETADNIIVSGAVLSPLTGTLGVTEAKDLAAIMGGGGFSTALAATEVADTASYAGGVRIDGTLNAVGPTDLASFVCVGQPTVSGSLAATEAPNAATFAGLTGLLGSFSAKESPDTADLAGRTGLIGSFAARETQDAATFSGGIVVFASLAARDAEDRALFRVASGFGVPGMPGPIPPVAPPNQIGLPDDSRVIYAADSRMITPADDGRAVAESGSGRVVSSGGARRGITSPILAGQPDDNRVVAQPDDNRMITAANNGRSISHPVNGRVASNGPTNGRVASPGPIRRVA